MSSALRLPAPPPLPWQRALPALLLLLGVLLGVYYDTAKAMVSIWARSDTFAHGFLVVPIVLWLVWRQRQALAVLMPKPSAWLLLPMAAVAFAWLLGDLASVNSVTQLALTALLVLAVPAVLGMQAAKLIAFPLAFLFFAVPLGEFLLPQLMSWTADFTVLALQATGIPVYREGNQFTIPSGNWSVVEACSGVRYLIASFMVGTLFGYLTYRSTRRRWIFAAISIAVPIVANWVRAYLIVLLGHYSGNKLAVGADHLIYGWLFFGVVVCLMYAIGMLWAEPGEPIDAPAKTPAPSPAIFRPQQPGKFWAVATAAVLVAVVPHLLLLRVAGIDDTGHLQLTHLAAPAGGWRRIEGPMSDWTPAFQNPSAQLTSTYALQDREVGVYIGYYRAQTYQRKLVSSDNSLVKSNDPRWARTDAEGSHALRTDKETLRFRTALLRHLPVPGRTEQRLLAWQVYWVGNKLTSSDLVAKAYAALDRLIGHGDESAVIVLYAREAASDGASELLEAFALANLDAIVAELRKSRDSAKASVATTAFENHGENGK